MDIDQLYRTHKSLLFSIAYRLLGSVVDAEDVVQETFLAWSERPQGAPVENERAYLCRVAVHKCADRIRKAQERRESYVGPWLPEPLVDGRPTPEDASERRESLHTAYLLLLQQLGVAERIVLVLREAFGFEYAEVAKIVGKSEANCRQLLHRAKRRMAELAGGAEALGRRATVSDADRVNRLATAFAHSIATGDVDQAVALLSPDAKLLTDGGGIVNAVPVPVLNARRVAAVLISVASKLSDRMTIEPAEVNGLPGWVYALDGNVVHVVSLAVDGERICGVYVVSNPEKLRHLNRASM